MRQIQRERELEPQLMLSAQSLDRRNAKGVAVTRLIADRGLSQNAKRCWRLLGLDSHSLGGKHKVNLNRATTQAKAAEHRNQLENLCAILENGNSKSQTLKQTVNKPPTVVLLGTSAFPCGKTSSLGLTASEMQTDTRGGSPSKRTPETQPTADENARSAGARTVRIRNP